jgi:hypothetical protein
MSDATCRTISASITSTAPTSARSMTSSETAHGERSATGSTMCSAAGDRCRSGSTRQAGSSAPDPSSTRPNMQLYFSPVSYTKAPPGKRPLMSPDPFPGLIMGRSPHARPAGAIWRSNPQIRSMRRRSTRITCRPTTIWPNSSKAPADPQACRRPGVGGNYG